MEISAAEVDIWTWLGSICNNQESILWHVNHIHQVTERQVHAQQDALMTLKKPFCTMQELPLHWEPQDQHNKLFLHRDQLKLLSMYMKISSVIAVVFTPKKVINSWVDMQWKSLDMGIRLMLQPIIGWPKTHGEQHGDALEVISWLLMDNVDSIQDSLLDHMPQQHLLVTSEKREDDWSYFK